jgi:hypothetical protein
MRSSALLLLVINRVAGAEGIVTGKVFEYVASGRPVLGIGPVQGDAAAVLSTSQAGAMHDWDDAEAVATFLRRHYDAWASGEALVGASPERSAPFSRREGTWHLAQILGTTVAP